MDLAGQQDGMSTPRTSPPSRRPSAKDAPPCRRAKPSPITIRRRSARPTRRRCRLRPHPPHLRLHPTLRGEAQLAFRPDVPARPATARAGLADRRAPSTARSPAATCRAFTRMPRRYLALGAVHGGDLSFPPAVRARTGRGRGPRHALGTVPQADDHAHVVFQPAPNSAASSAA